MLNRIHSTPPDKVPTLLDAISPTLQSCGETCAAIAALIPANQFWKWKDMWTFSLRNAVFTAAMVEFLRSGSLLTIAQVSQVLGIKEEWSGRFVLTAEDYLHGLISLVNELSRLAVNSVTMGNFEMPIKISIFVKDIFAGFAMLNLKNDALRRRYDSLKYDIKKIEEVVYDVSLQVQWWSVAADALKQISSGSETTETIGRVNRLLSAWPQDDALPAEGYDGVKSIFKKLNSGLKEIKESADRDIKAIDQALEPLGVLIALRKAPPETTPPDKRNKRPRGPSPPGAPTPVMPAPAQVSRGASIAIPPRSSVGPQPPIPFSREPRARREALAKQLPLEKGRKVAFHPPQNTKGADAASGGKDEEWILAVVTKCINQDKNRYEVQDPEPQEDGQPGQCYNTTLRAIIPLPDPSAPPDSASHLNAYPEFAAGSTVMALYPDTSCFYRAEGGPGGKHAVPMYRLKFEDDDDQEHLVQAQSYRPPSISPSSPLRGYPFNSDVDTPPRRLSIAESYYYGLPSSPRLVARTGDNTLWEAPMDLETYGRRKQFYNVSDHPIQDVWEDDLALDVHRFLKSENVDWTSTDILRSKPGSLSDRDGARVAFKCLDVLKQRHITDVEVEIRESLVTRQLAGPKLLTPDCYNNRIAAAREPRTSTLGLPICAKDSTNVEGTGGFFLSEGGNTNRLLLVTARHVVFPPQRGFHAHYETNNPRQRRRDVLLFGDSAFVTYVESLQSAIGRSMMTASIYEERLGELETEFGKKVDAERKQAEAEVAEANKTREALEALYEDVSTFWQSRASRQLGRVILSPPIGVGKDGYTRDWAIVQIENSKVDKSNFVGNAIDLGTSLSPAKFELKMCANIEEPTSFKWPVDRLLKIEGTISDAELRQPTSLDQHGEPCFIVIKRGAGTGLTFGRACSVVSYTRSFSGDSGAVIVDGRGRVAGLLTGGGGATTSADISYATPITSLLKSVKEEGILDPNVTPPPVA
ncbi:hypothetical protein NM688_g4028 [Phlebia brevispora]|uniref:Uncharacterized protein n=1 Tax=Phlebia brevispora TaxID=194682 RepID=A0ACC1T432_9APHY|nr:hypothetical protein NM688_g4028 [Phlebia brevispora]